MQIWPLPWKAVRTKSPAKTVTKPVVVVEWDRTELRYVVTVARGESIRLLGAGRIPKTDSPPLMQLASHLQDLKLNAHQLVLVLSRADLELMSITVPPSTDEELPAIIQAEVEQKLGEMEAPPITDFILEAKKIEVEEAQGTREILAFAMTENQLQAWEERAKEAKFRLVAITSRHLAPLATLEACRCLGDERSVSICYYSGEVEIVLCDRNRPIFLRSVRASSEEPSALAEQIALEIQRCIALAPMSQSNQDLQLFLFGAGDEPNLLADSLRERKVGNVRIIDATQGWENEIPGTEYRPASDAATLGASRDFLRGALVIDLLNPKRAPTKPNPWKRWGAIAGFAAAALLTLLYFSFTDIWQLQEEVQALEIKASQESSIASKLQEKADEVVLVDNWLKNQVDWIEEIRELSVRLPDGQNATVRRLTATVNEQGGIIDLGVQVKEPDKIAELENSLRSARFDVASKRVSQQPSEDEYPWQFDTRISFPIEIRKLQYAPPTGSTDQSSPSAQPSRGSESDNEESEKQSKAKGKEPS